MTVEEDDRLDLVAAAGVAGGRAELARRREPGQAPRPGRGARERQVERCRVAGHEDRALHRIFEQKAVGRVSGQLQHAVADGVRGAADRVELPGAAVEQAQALLVAAGGARETGAQCRVQVPDRDLQQAGRRAADRLEAAQLQRLVVLARCPQLADAQADQGASTQGARSVLQQRPAADAAGEHDCLVGDVEDQRPGALLVGPALRRDSGGAQPGRRVEEDGTEPAQRRIRAGEPTVDADALVVQGLQHVEHQPDRDGAGAQALAEIAGPGHQVQRLVPDWLMAAPMSRPRGRSRRPWITALSSVRPPMSTRRSPLASWASARAATS